VSEADAIVSVQAWLAFTLTESPCVDEFKLPTLTAGAEEESDPIWTFTLGGTVTLTVWVRLADPFCAVAMLETSSVAHAAATIVRPSPTISRASREPVETQVIFYRRNMHLAL
jgi:hypothetical protein